MYQNTNKNFSDDAQKSGGILFKNDGNKGNNLGNLFEEDDLKIDSVENLEFGIEEKELKNENDENVELKNMSTIEVFAVKKKLIKIREEIDSLLKILGEDVSSKEYKEKFINKITASHSNESYYDATKVIEGVFDGEQMVGEDGETYVVPPNYASKSKLVEGDMLKLRILENGKFIYKQIEKIERKNATGKLFYNEETKEYAVFLENGRKYKVLSASITYYKAEIGEEIIITIPASGESAWGAVESVSKN